MLEMGGQAEKNIYGFDMCWADYIMGWEYSLMGAQYKCIGLVPLLSIRWFCYFVKSDILAFGGCFASLKST